MMIHLRRDQVPPQLLGAYTGHKIRLRPATNLTIPGDNGRWSEGSRSDYEFVRLSDGATIHAPTNSYFGADMNRERSVALGPTVAVRKRSVFRGNDMGLDLYVHPDVITPLLPAPSAGELDADQKLVLRIFKRFKPNYRAHEAAYRGVEFNRFNAIVTRLHELGFLKRNAVTIEGKNYPTD